MISQQIPGVLVQYDTQAGLLRVSWLTGKGLSLWRPMLEELLVFSKIHNLYNWLVNIDEMPPLPPEYQAWANEYWYTATSKCPLRHMALVMPPSIHNQQAAQDSVAHASSRLSFEQHFFMDEAAAFDWLLHEQAYEQRLQLAQEWRQAKTSLAGNHVLVYK